MKIAKKDLDMDFIRKWMDKGVNPILLSVLNRRGVDSNKELINMFLPAFESIFSPFLFKDIIKAFKRIDCVIENNEKVIVFGDRDVDGATSLAIMVNFLRELGIECEWALPVGDEPYSLYKNTIKQWHNKYNLCITVDCGISSFEEVDLLNDFGIDTIIIDHHHVQDKLPNAFAIINPKAEEKIEFSDIAACAVSFFFIFGYIIYKSDLFNKEVSITYFDNNRYFVDTYKNFLLVSSNQVNELNEITSSDNMDYFFLDEGLLKYVPDMFKKISIEKSTKIAIRLGDKKLAAKLNLFIVLYKTINNLEKLKEKYLQFTMIGTIADIMPLKKENRIFVTLGLQYLNKSPNQNILAIINKLNLSLGVVNSKDIGWKIAPLLNSSGRMGDARFTASLLINNNVEVLDKIYFLNEERKKKGEEAYNLFVSEIEKNKSIYDGNLNFFYSNNIIRGITGVTASKLADEAKVPVIVAAKDGELYTGSMRGECDYHFVDFLSEAEELFSDFGGHSGAAGFRFKEDKLDEIISFFKSNSGKLRFSSIDENYYIDAEIPESYLNSDLLKIFKPLEPFGEQNENPVLYTKGLGISSYTIMGKTKNHLKLNFFTSNGIISGVFWNKASWFKSIHQDSNLYDILYKIELNTFMGKISPVLKIEDMDIVK